MKQKLLLSFCLCLLLSFGTWAQNISVKGTVKDGSTGEAVPGVSIIIQGTSTGTVTDVNGQYDLDVPQGATLVFSAVGYTNQNVVVGAETEINVTMEPSTQELGEVIVTAQGIERKKEALGFAVSTVDSKEIADRTEGDVVRSLRSKASGVNITQQNGLSGSGTNILIRGYTSITGDNQPLFIVDGVPFNTSTNNNNGDGSGASDFVNGSNNGSSRFLDLDPNNIESINILKGLAAATLYGSQGRNGVVLITTKSGSGAASSKKMDISVTQSLFVNEIASLPDYQDQFGNGFDQVFGWFFSNWGPSFNETGLAGWSTDASVDANGNLPHPYSQYSNSALRAVFPQFVTQPGQGVAGRTVNGEVLHGVPYEWRPYNNVEEFFRTGLVSTTSISARGRSADGKTNYGMSFGYTDDQGFTPGNNMDRLTFSVGGSSRLANKVLINGTMNLSRTNFVSPPVSASEGNGAFNPNGTTPVSSSVFGHVFFTPRSIDLTNLPFEHPVNGSSVYYRNGNDIQNPNWTAKNAFNGQLVHRIYGTVGIGYDITKNLNVAYRLGYDIYNERNESGQHKGGLDGPILGQYRTFDNISTIWDHTFTLNGDYTFNKIGLNFNVGATSRGTKLSRQGVTSTNQVIFGIYRHFNFTNQSPIQFEQEQNIIGFFGQTELNYDGYLFVTLAGRYDIVSNFDTDNRTLFYPSISTSFLLSEVVPAINNIGIDVLKLRAGFGTSAGFRVGYPTQTVLQANPRTFLTGDGTLISSNTTGVRLGNPGLKPELQQEFELGFEARAWNNRVTFDLSWYRRTSRDQIIDRPLDPSTGFTVQATNIGEILNRGLELDVSVDALRFEGFNWNIRANFTRQRNEVTDLGADTDKIAYAGFSNLGNFAQKGQPLGVIQGNRIMRNDDGDFVVNSAGDYIVEEGTFVIGDPNPDYILNVSTEVSYKGFALNAVFNFVKGGDIYSRTVSTLLGRGLTTDTEDRLQTFILPGVKNIGTSDNPDYVENDLQINNSSFYFNNVLFGPDELGIFDGTTIRLQEVSLSYTFPKSIVDKTPFGNITLIASGFNLWYNAVNMPDGTNFDPNVAGLGVGNGLGFDYLNGPSSRRYGGTLKFSF